MGIPRIAATGRRPHYARTVPAVLRPATSNEPFFNYLGQLELADEDDELQVINAYEGDALIGSIVYDIGKTETGAVWVRHVYVKLAWRGSGLFKQLAQFAIDDALWQRQMRGDDYRLDGDFIQQGLREWFQRRLEQAAITAKS